MGPPWRGVAFYLVFYYVGSWARFGRGLIGDGLWPTGVVLLSIGAWFSSGKGFRYLHDDEEEKGLNGHLIDTCI